MEVELVDIVVNKASSGYFSKFMEIVIKLNNEN